MQFKNFKKSLSLILAICMIAMVLTACGSSSSSRDDYKSAGDYTAAEEAYYFDDYDMEYAEEPEFYPEAVKANGAAGGGSGSGITTTTFENTKDSKLVYTADISAETKEFDADLEALTKSIQKHGGYISGSNFSDSWRYGRSYGYRQQYITIRIPTENYTTFLSELRGIGHVTSTSDYVEDITQSYYSTKTTLESLNAQLEFLMNMYNEAETIEEMLEVRDRIVDVQNQIAILTNRIETMDNEVDYSTINYTLTEVVEYSDTTREAEEKTFGEKFKDAAVECWKNFVAFISGFVLFIMGNLWWILLVAIIVIVIIVVEKKNKPKRERKRAAERAAREQRRAELEAAREKAKKETAEKQEKA